MTEKSQRSTEKKRIYANGILAASVICCLGSAPWMDQYIWANGLFHLSFASSVGGFADWFAVRSLFGKPLGIRIRTNLISRHRDEIETMVQEFATHTLLNKEWFASFFKTCHPSEWLASIWQEYKKEWIRAGETVCLYIFHSEEFQNIVREIKEKGKKEISSMEWDAVVTESLQNHSSDFFHSFIAPFLADEMQRFYTNPELRQVITEIVYSFWKEYKEKSVSRQIFHFFADKDGKKSVKAMLDAWQQASFDLKDPESLLYKKAEKAWGAWTQSFLNDEEKKEKLNHWLGTKAYAFIDRKTDAFFENPDQEKELARTVSLYVSQYIEKMLLKKTIRKMTDRWGRHALIHHISFFQKALASLIHIALSPYDKDKLSALAEEKAGSEIEVIRVNGSLFGGALGLLFFFLSETTGLL